MSRLILQKMDIDVNVEPNKSTVMVHSPAEIEKGIEQLLDLAYPLLPDEVVFDETPESPNSSSPLLAPSNPDDVQSMETRSIFIPSSSLSALPRWSAEKSVFSDSTRYTNNSTVETVEQPKTASNATSILNLMIEDDIEIDLAEWSAGNVPTLVKGGGGANVNVGQQNSQPVDVRSCKPWLDRGWFDRIGHGIAEKAPSERPQMQNWERRSLASSVAVEDERQCRIQDFWAGTTTTKSASSSDTRTQQPNDNTLPSTPKQVARIATPTAKSTAHVTNSPANIHTPKGVLDSAGRRSDGSRQSTLDHFLSGKHAQASSPTPSRKPRNIVTPQKLQRLSKSDGGFRSLVTSEIAAIVPALDLIRRQHRETRMQVRSWVKDRGYGRDQRKRKAINAIGRVPGHREDLWSFPWLIQANGRMFLVNMFRMWETLLMKRLTERCIHSITKTFETLNTREPLNGSTKSGRLEDVTLVSFSGEFSYEPAVLTLDRENGIRDLLSVRSTPASVQLAQYVKSTSKVLAKHQAGVASNSIFNVQAEHILVQHAVENFVSGFGIEPQRDSVWYSPDEGGEIAMALE
ncbi:hypothetical protein BJ742DRAFT_20674 [Cladochytrium replicatum]|nr:hypothetical protein BJ742DRAFT_20674 [Cladochytrium replicatum]